MHIPTFKMPTIKQVWQFIQQGNYTSSMDLKVSYLDIPIVKHHHHFSVICLAENLYQWKVLPFGLATAPCIFTSLTKPILFLCCCKGFCIVIYVDYILILVHSKHAGKRA